jgi:hypothetical protein
MAKSASKTINNSTDIQLLTTSGTWCEYLNEDAFMMFPGKDDWRKRFMYTLLEWASKEDSLEITDFAIAMKMRRRTLYKWAEEYEDIKDALDNARLIIGSRRRKGALTRKFDKDVAFKDMHKYDPEWIEINKYHSEMRKDEDKQAHTFIINDIKPRIVTKEEMSGRESTMSGCESTMSEENT